MRSWRTTKQMTSELNKPWNFFFLQLKRRTISGPPKTIFFQKWVKVFQSSRSIWTRIPCCLVCFFLGYMAILQSISKPKNQCFKILSNSEKECFLLFFVVFEQNARKGHLMPKLLKLITNSADGSVEGLCRLLDHKTLPLLQEGWVQPNGLPTKTPGAVKNGGFEPRLKPKHGGCERWNKKGVRFHWGSTWRIYPG